VRSTPIVCDLPLAQLEIRPADRRHDHGGDNLRVYPVKVEDGAVWLDTRDPPAAERIERALRHLDQAMAEYDTARIARELARLGMAGAEPEMALARAIQETHARLRDGMTHAYAAAEAWLRLRDTLADEASRLVCATEVLVYIAFDTLRERTYPFTAERAPWSVEDFAAAIESQDEERAAALLNGAIAQGLHLPTSTRLAKPLAHYNDFGHSLIYLMHVRRLIDRLEATWKSRCCWHGCGRSSSPREDLLPDFRRYAEALRHGAPAQDWSTHTLAGARRRCVRRALGARRAEHDRGRRGTHRSTFTLLMETSARHLLRFDERHGLRTDNGVADNNGWLDFTMPSPSDCACNAHANPSCGRRVCCNWRCLSAATAGIWTRISRRRPRFWSGRSPTKRRSTNAPSRPLSITGWDCRSSQRTG
jgi:hypothetical protein